MKLTAKNAGTPGTLWIDGKGMLTQVTKHSDYETETVTFITLAPLLLDNTVIGELPR